MAALADPKTYTRTLPHRFESHSHCLSHSHGAGAACRKTLRCPGRPTTRYADTEGRASAHNLMEPVEHLAPFPKRVAAEYEAASARPSGPADGLGLHVPQRVSLVGGGGPAGAWLSWLSHSLRAAARGLSSGAGVDWRRSRNPHFTARHRGLLGEVAGGSYRSRWVSLVQSTARAL